MSEIYVISDTHFSDEAIIAITGRPFSSTKEMNRTIIENINEFVGTSDTLIHLGDVGHGSLDEIQDSVSQIKCNNKILIMGNHDRCFSPQTWRDIGFQEVSPWPIIYNDWYIMCHEPVFLEINSPFAVIYGHTHQNSYDSPNHHYFNASVEVTDYKPILFNDIMKKIVGKKK
jgi:calcineurin-like phosphoesterase family protein